MAVAGAPAVRKLLRKRQLADVLAETCSRSASTSASGLDSINPYIKGEAGYRPTKPYLSYVEKVRAEQLLSARVHLGHQQRKTHPSVTGQLYGFRHNIAVFDINKTWRSMRTLFYAFAEMASMRSTFFLLAPNPNLPLEALIEQMRKEYPFRYDRFNSLYMLGYSDKKWIDGMFSNWKITMEYARSVREKLEKKPNVSKFKKLERYLKGVEDLDAYSRIFPDFVLVLARDAGALHEIRNAELPLMGIVDSNEDPSPFLYPVFANNDSIESIQFVLDLIKRGIEEGRKREQEAFALLMIRKIKQHLDPNNGTGVAIMEPAAAVDEEDKYALAARRQEDAGRWMPPNPLDEYKERPEWLSAIGGDGYIKVPRV